MMLGRECPVLGGRIVCLVTLEKCSAAFADSGPQSPKS